MPETDEQWLTADELAAELSKTLGGEITAGMVRERARKGEIATHPFRRRGARYRRPPTEPETDTEAGHRAA